MVSDIGYFSRKVITLTALVESVRRSWYEVPDGLTRQILLALHLSVVSFDQSLPPNTGINVVVS